VERTLCQSLDDDRTLPELWSRGVRFRRPAMEMIADGHQRDYFLWLFVFVVEGCLKTRRAKRE